jgi:hypothetical protein
MELERSEDILIVTHQAVLRCIYAYFMKKDQEESPWMAVPLHTLIKLTPRAYGTQEERYNANIPAVSTWRAKGSIAKHEDPVDDTICLGGESFKGKDIDAQLDAPKADSFKLDVLQDALKVIITDGKENDSLKAPAPAEVKL